MSEIITIRAFRAIDDPDTCELFFEGHVNVLRSYGVEPISSSKNDWFYNPEVYGLIAELNGRAVGGVKIHKVGGTQALPIEESIGYLDKGIYDLVREYTPEGTGEACGMWNAKEVAGFGVSFVLSRATMVLTDQIHLSKLFALSSDHTLELFRHFGFQIVHSLGENGDFTYPNPDYISRVLVSNANTLSRIPEYNKGVIQSLRKKPIQLKKDKIPNGMIEIDYQLQLSI